MDNSEMSKFFDIVYDNITSGQAPGLNEYEKSHFLTTAQEAIVKEIYEGTRNFEGSEYSSEALQPLVREIEYTIPTGNPPYKINRPEDMPSNNTKLMFIVYEELKGTVKGCTDDSRYLVYPTTHNEFYSVINNPFRGPKGNRAIRLLSNSKIEIWPPDNVVASKYIMRYIKKPEPIVLAANNDYTVDSNTQTNTQCELPEFLHRTIVNRAAALAKAVWEA